MMSKRIHSLYWALLGLLLAAGFFLRTAGLQEGIELHPDEVKIAAWMEDMQARHSLLPDVYPGGFFVLASGVHHLLDWTVRPAFHRWRYFTRQTDRFEMPPMDPVPFGRHCNVWMGVLTILLTAALVRRITGSRFAALLAAAWMAFAPFALEHAHYLETDIAMLFALALTLCLFTRFLDRRRITDWAFAALAAGFAAGTKFTMIGLLLLLPVCIRRPRCASPSSSPWKTTGWIAGLLAGGILLFALGFLAASPDARFAGPFRQGLARGGASVFAETAGLVGEAIREPFIREGMNLKNLQGFSTSLHTPWLLLALFGLALAFRKPQRRFWPIMLFFPLTFTYYLIFQAPWIRSQEFLALLPNLALLGALPLAALWRMPAPRAAGLRKSAAVLLAGIAVWPVFQNGCAVSSEFAWLDTQRLANRDLATSYPPEILLGAESYTGAAAENVARETFSPRKYLFLEADDLPHYFLVNANRFARGLRHPRTHAFYPEYAERKAAMETHGYRIAAWGPLDSPGPHPTFRAHTLELWRTPEHNQRSPTRPVYELGIPLPRPTLVKDPYLTGDSNAWGRLTFFQGGAKTGPHTAMQVDKHPREIAIGGPGALTNPVYLVFGTAERAAAFRAKGFGQCQRIALGPHDAGILVFQRPWWKPALSRFECVRIAAEAGGPTLEYLPAYVYAAFSPEDAAAILLDAGHPEKAGALLREHGVEEMDVFWRVLAGDAQAIPEARERIRVMRQHMVDASTDADNFSTEGLPFSVWQDFAQIRLLGFDAETRPLPHAPPPGKPDKAALRLVPFATILPIQGVGQTIQMDVAQPHAPASENIFEQLAFVNDITPMKGVQAESIATTGSTRLSLSSADFPARVDFVAQTYSALPFYARNACYRWDVFNMLSARLRQIESAIERLEKPLPEPAVQFGNLLSLERMQPQENGIQFTFRTLHAHTPPLAIQLRKLRRGKWRTAGEPRPLNPPQEKEKRFSVTLPLPPEADLQQLGFRIRTDVPYHPSSVPLTRTTSADPFVVPLNAL